MPRASAGEHHKGFQQVRRSSAHFHFVRQRASLYRWLASESLAWSFFYASSYPECTGAHDNRPLTDEVDGGWWRVWGGADVEVNIFRGAPRGRRGLRNTLRWPDEVVMRLSVTSIPLGCHQRQRECVTRSVDYKSARTLVSCLALTGVFVLCSLLPWRGKKLQLWIDRHVFMNPVNA